MIIFVVVLQHFKIKNLVKPVLTEFGLSKAVDCLGIRMIVLIK